MTVGMCPNEKHVDEREAFDELGFVKIVGKADNESKEGICSDESVVARMAIPCTSSTWEVIDIWPVCPLTEEKNVE